MTLASDIAGGTVEYAADVCARTELRLGFRVPGWWRARQKWVSA